jgi:hypothetical protein
MIIHKVDFDNKTIKNLTYFIEINPRESNHIYLPDLQVMEIDIMHMRMSYY